MKLIFCLIWGLLFPFLGTAAGAALVWCFDRDSAPLGRMFSGGAAGVMGAAALFGLLLPGLALSPWAFAGAVLGAIFLMIPGGLVHHRGWLVALAVILHNIPEGMATGVSFGSWMSGSGIFAADALAVGLGIGLQNVPDGAMVALPLRRQGMSRCKAWAVGMASGLVEPIAALVLFRGAGLLGPWLPILMGFAAGAMLWVVAAELIPALELGRGKWDGLLWALVGLGSMLWVL